MATIVVVREMKAGGHREDSEIEVQDDVASVAARVNQAVNNGDKFLSLTGMDGKEFTVVAAKVQDIRAT